MSHPQPAHAAVPAATHTAVQGRAHDQIVPTPPSVPTAPTPGGSTGSTASGGNGKATISLDFGDSGTTGNGTTANGTANGTAQNSSGGNQSIFIILLLTVMSVAPA